mgnify:CR=1 FL=1
MSTIVGTQDFIRAHREHNLVVSLISSVDSRGSGSVVDIDGTLTVMAEKDEFYFIDDISAYVSCHDCQAEMEVNLYEVEME